MSSVIKDYSITTDSRFKNRGVVIIEGHVQGLANTRAFGKLGIPVIVVDKGNCVAKYSKYCSKYFKCPDYLDESFISFLIELAEKEGLQDWMLLPSNDHAVYNISKNKRALEKHFRIITEELDVIEKIYNKRSLLELALSVNVPIPPTVMPTIENPSSVNLRYPLLVKGNNGLSFAKKYKAKALLIEDEKELQQLWNTTLKGISPEEYFVQEVLPFGQKTVSVTVFSVEGVIHSYWMGVKLREHPIRFGTATCCQSVFIDELLEPTELLIKNLKYTGVCEIEFLKDSRDGIHKLIEINARTWLWVGLAIECGINYPKMIYQYLYDSKIPTYNGYKTGLIWLNRYTDFVYSLKSVIKGNESLKQVLSSYKKPIEACWDKTDVVPFFMYGLLTMHFLKNR